MLKKLVPILCLIAVTVVVITVLAVRPAGIQREYDGFTVNPDGKSGVITGTVDGLPVEELMRLHSKPYYGGSHIVYSHEGNFILGGMAEIYIAENADLIESVKDIKNLLAGKSAMFRVVKYSKAYLQEIAKEIEAARDAVFKPQTPETAKFFEPGVKEAVGDIINAGVELQKITVYINWKNNESIEVLKQLFPYDFIVYDTPAIAVY